MMPRNLDRRVEVLVPVEQPRLKQELTAVFDSAFADTESSWELGADGTWTRRKRSKEGRAHGHQVNLQRRAKARRAFRLVTDGNTDTACRFSNHEALR